MTGVPRLGLLCPSPTWRSRAARPKPWSSVTCVVCDYGVLFVFLRVLQCACPLDKAECEIGIISLLPPRACPASSASWKDSATKYLICTREPREGLRQPPSGDAVTLRSAPRARAWGSPRPPPSPPARPVSAASRSVPRAAPVPSPPPPSRSSLVCPLGSRRSAWPSPSPALRAAVKATLRPKAERTLSAPPDPAAGMAPPPPRPVPAVRPVLLLPPLLS